MSTQRFHSSPTDTFTFPNGAIGHRTGAGHFDSLGPYAKVRNCPIDGTDLRLTCYATDYSDTFFSIPACTRYKRRYISGFFMLDDKGGVVFHAHSRHADRLPTPISPKEAQT